LRDLATRPSQQAIAALAGTQFIMSPGPQWWAAVPRYRWPDGLAEVMQTVQERKLADGVPSEEMLWDAAHGDRRTELVCIGRELDHEAARAQLAACLLTPEEMAMGQESWFALADPFV
jgi:G3E family GTPase